MVEIFSKVNEEVIDGVRVSYKYWIDEYDVCWIRYIDMVSFLGLTEQKANELMHTIEANGDRFDFEDYEFDNYGKGSYCPRTFITTDAVAYLIDRNNKHNNIFVKSINNLTTSTNNENEIDEIVNNMKKCMEDCNLDALIYNSGKLYNSELGRERMDRLGVINKEKEKVIDVFRDKVYNEEIKWMLDDYDGKDMIKLSTDDDIWSNWF